MPNFTSLSGLELAENYFPWWLGGVAVLTKNKTNSASIWVGLNWIELDCSIWWLYQLSYSLLFRVGGWPGKWVGGWLEKLKLRPPQPEIELSIEWKDLINMITSFLLVHLTYPMYSISSVRFFHLVLYLSLNIPTI